ncbi:hypothetical protein LJC30_06235, partial [Odoribacter sp. OttesenSCG-928-L07]|nr:hypothetical protein [Odoribacter sp. OttesenSCG-928-L07]
MKRIHKIITLLTLCFLFLGLKGYSQNDTAYVFYQSEVIYKSHIKDIDSIRFINYGSNYIRIFKSNMIDFSRPVTQIDSIIFYQPPTPATVITNAVTNIMEASATLNGDITFVGSPEYTERGFCYSTNNNPTVNDTKIIVEGNGTGEYSVEVDELESNTQYYVRAYVESTTGAVYGDTKPFKTLSGTLATVTTLPISNVTDYSATLGGNIITIGNPEYTEKGICYSTSTNPTISNKKVIVEGDEVGEYFVDIKNLSLNTLYYVRAYAVNEAGIAYGNEIEFTTLPAQPFTYYGDIILSKEEEVIAVRDAGYKYIRGKVTVKGDILQTLTLLNNQIKEISGNLLFEAKNLTTFDGFYGLEKIYESLILKDGKMANFEGLNNLNSIGENFEISSSNSLKALTSFSGLESLQSVGGNLEITSSYSYYSSSLNSLISFSGL